MALYKNKFRIESTRLHSWDYRWNAAYFITICTKNREHFFGEIINGSIGIENEMEFTDTGKLAGKFWIEISTHFPFTTLDAFTVMPNHIHGILIINNIHTIETLPQNGSLIQKNELMSNISPKKGSISAIIRSYKSAVSKHAHSKIPHFAWQERFHDHIIRDEHEFYQIQNYIRTNPQNWMDDMFYK